MPSSRPTPDNTPFSLEPIKRIARGDSSNVSTLHMSAHTGTHVDAPRHFFDDGAGAEALPLELLIGRARVIEVDVARRRSPPRTWPASTCRTTSALLHQDAQLAALGLAGVPPGLRRRHRVGREASGRARHQGASASTTCRSKQFKNAGAPAHHVLLGAGTIVIEGLNLRDVEPGIYEMFCLPLRVVGADGAPARVVLRRS